MTNMLPSGYRDVEALQQRLKNEPEEVWIRRGQQMALELFHDMSERVPAYKDFLEKLKFNPKSVEKYEDFKNIPPINKDNYLRKYPKPMLSWDGKFPAGQWVISTTSGSTGQPYYFPRQELQDWQYAVTAELYLRSNFSIHKKSTLYIVAFPMGAWIGGLFTYEALKLVAQGNNYNLSIITPGIHKQEVINAVKNLGDNYDQIIIGAYAPFLKDILDDGIREGIDWTKHNLGFVFSAEAFTERFRDYVLDTVSTKDSLKATLNHYGTVDLGTMAHETPESILIRRHLVDDGTLQTLFPEKVRQPTFAQFNPELFNFEAEAGNLFCTANSGLPLVRYDLKDYGGVLTRSEVHDKLKASGIDTSQELKNAAIEDTAWNLPFVYVYERNDFSVSYYAFLIYPDTVRRALQDEVHAQEITGKFTMLVDYDQKGRQQLNMHIEAKRDVPITESLKTRLRETIHAKLLGESSEYRETAKMVGDVVKPIIHIWEYENPTHFRAGTKQKWVIK